jgi:hypothetical protein
LPIIHLTHRQTESHLDQCLIGTIRQKAVHLKKCQHNHNTDPFIGLQCQAQLNFLVCGLNIDSVMGSLVRPQKLSPCPSPNGL